MAYTSGTWETPIEQHEAYEKLVTGFVLVNSPYEVYCMCARYH
jgi:hypothetical protein